MCGGPSYIVSVTVPHDGHKGPPKTPLLGAAPTLALVVLSFFQFM